MVFNPVYSFLEDSAMETASRWAGKSPTAISNEMKKLQHNWTGSVLAEETVSKSKAKQALDSTFIAGVQSDDDEFQDIMQVLPLSYLLNLMGLSLTDATIDADSGNTTISGFNAYKNLTIDSGFTLTLKGQPSLLLVTGTLENNGTIKKSITGGSGGSGHALQGGGTEGRGGDGGGGAYLLTRKLLNKGTITLPGTDGENSGYADENTNGGAGSGGLELTVDGGINYTEGNNGGVNGGTGKTNSGGGGGENATPNNGGDGGDAGTSNFTANTTINHIYKVLLDQWIENIESRSPTSTESELNIRGSGGGGGAGSVNTTGAGQGGGGGGGGGGELLAYIKELDNQGTLETPVGIGGSGYGAGGNGGNGGTGSIVIGYKTLTTQGIINGNSTLIDASQL